MAAAIFPALKIAGGLLLGKVASKAVGSVIGGKKKAPAPAPEAGPKVMPLADDEAIRRARKNALVRQLGRSGRSSTILSGDSETLGGG